MSKSLFLHFSSESTDIPLKRPRSLINVIGTNATFTCVSPLKNCVEMTWQRGLGRWGFPINYDNYPSFRGKYIVENSTLGCQLTVANVQFYDVAIYECKFMKSFIGTANLFAISKSFANFDLFCSVNNFNMQETDFSQRYFLEQQSSYGKLFIYLTRVIKHLRVYFAY